ncbi:pre-mRNA-processing protein 40A isoform X2 [Ziziphus jujuba]|uniref:Pre-mRNA-processing protein 40A isoform X2 n=1 Tax=Ziziphus jujuba TaxID=326968 RepID=A0ABM3IW37_ZIZJJ|nr:pre-mRNA-processing protein 40A isoform X2 [Ziziphus jujuba]
MDPPQTLPSMSSQFRPPIPALPQSQQFIPVGSQHFQPVGRGVPMVNVRVPPQAPKPPVYGQPMPQLPPRPGQPGMLLPSQTVPLAVGQPKGHFTSESPLPLPSSQAPNNYMPSLGGGRGMPLSSSYTFTPSYGVQRGNDGSTQYQSIPQVHVANVSSGGQLRPSTESQSTAIVTPMQQTNEQPPMMNVAAPATSTQPSLSAEASSDWREHTSADGRRYYYNRKTKLSSWDKPLELMTATERADASTNWKEFTSLDGRKYYYNKVTKESKWRVPEELKLVREKVEKASVEETQQEMPVNSSVPTSVSPTVAEPTPSGDTSSSKAEGVASSPVSVAPVPAADLQTMVVPRSSALPVVAATMKTNTDGDQIPTNAVLTFDAVTGSAGTSVTGISIATEPMNNVNNFSAMDVVGSADEVHVLVKEEDLKGVIGEKISDTASEDKTVDREPLVYGNKQEAKNAFKALLEDANIGCDWTWDRAMRVIINDKRYGVLKTLGDRKQAFNEFLIQRKKQDAEERRMKQKKAREEFKKMLEESTELTSSMRWGKAESLFESDERFKLVERDRDRRDLFENHVEELRKKERAKAQEERKCNIMEYRHFLESCDFIKASSQWRRVQDRLEADERCLRLEKIDRLEIFVEYTRDLQKEEEEQKKIQKEELRKVERKNRDQFRKLMEDNVAAGLLTAKTHWREYCMKVKDLPAYKEVASNTSGPTPKDLFEDVAEELQKQYHEDRTQIKDAIKLRKIMLSTAWTFEELKSAIVNDISSPPVSDTNLKTRWNQTSARKLHYVALMWFDTTWDSCWLDTTWC